MCVLEVPLVEVVVLHVDVAVCDQAVRDDEIVGFVARVRRSVMPAHGEKAGEERKHGDDSCHRRRAREPA